MVLKLMLQRGAAAINCIAAISGGHVAEADAATIQGIIF